MVETMLFANRTDWDHKPNNITQLLNKLKSENVRILDLTESNPTKCNLNYPEQSILDGLLNSNNLNYTPSPKGSLLAREEISNYYIKKGIEVDVNRIMLTSSTSEAYTFLFRLLADPGDSILFPSPSYPLFQFLVDINDLNYVSYPLQYENSWSIDKQKLSRALTSNSKAVVLVNPNNPTGSYVNKYELEYINELIGEKDIAVISDEVFSDFVFEEDKVYPTVINNSRNLSFTLGGLSKSLALPQMKISWIVISGPEELTYEAISRLEIISDTYLSVNTPSQNAVKVWFSNQEKIQKELIARIKSNKEYLVKELESSFLCNCLSIQGGWYAVVEFTKKIDEEKLILDLLKEDHVYVHPGYFFDFAKESYVVLSLLPKGDIFQEGLSRIIKRIEIIS